MRVLRFIQNESLGPEEVAYERLSRDMNRIITDQAQWEGESVRLAIEAHVSHHLGQVLRATADAIFQETVAPEEKIRRWFGYLKSRSGLLRDRLDSSFARK